MNYIELKAECISANNEHVRMTYKNNKKFVKKKK